MAGYLHNFINNYATVAAPLYELTRKEVKFLWRKKEEKAFFKIKECISNDKTVAYFDPKRPIILWMEARYHEGLSAALYQQTSGSNWWISSVKH